MVTKKKEKKKKKKKKKKKRRRRSLEERSCMRIEGIHLTVPGGGESSRAMANLNLVDRKKKRKKQNQQRTVRRRGLEEECLGEQTLQVQLQQARSIDTKLFPKEKQSQPL
ncbi:uncharacterized protein DS421_10g302950 [Arachis hypogaea]|nr:uncharacterized protein DS421_10g302950 [Arachis hypogaea]